MKRLPIALLTLTLTASLSAAQIVIPAAGAGPGSNGSLWMSDVTVHNVGTAPAEITLEYRSRGTEASTHALTIGSRETVTLENIVETTFGTTGTGAILIHGDEFVLRKLSVTSRTFNRSDSGDFGQDIPAWHASEAAGEGDTAVLNGPVDPTASRFNFGVYALEDTSIDWMLIREDGLTAATLPATYETGDHVQYNQGISRYLGAENLAGDVIYARIREGSAFVYGSIVENSTNDPSFVPFTATRENFAAQLLGVDLNEDGEIDIADADGDGVLDAEVKLSTTGFPNFFRLIVVDPEGSEVSIELVDSSSDVRLLNDATIQWLPSPMLRGTTGVLKVRATDGFASAEFLIPVLFR